MVRRAVAAVAAHGGEVLVVHRGTQLTFSGLEVDVLWPPADSRRPDGSCRFGLNDASIVLRVSFGARRILLTGDLEAQGEEALLSGGTDLRADVLKVGHHGSRSSTTLPFLRAVDPSVALVSGVWRPGNMPPHGQILERLTRAQIATSITSRDGAISVEIQENGTLRTGSAPSNRVLRMFSKASHGMLRTFSIASSPGPGGDKGDDFR
jgi:competence protein ComEC